jgi:hypothetical protein
MQEKKESKMADHCKTLIDDRLSHLMAEVQQLEKNYGFSEEFTSQKKEIVEDQKGIVNFPKAVCNLIFSPGNNFGYRKTDTITRR